MTGVGSIVLAAAEGGRWRPGIGDPTVLGWVTVAAYLAASLGCALAAWREPKLDAGRRSRMTPSRFWLVLALLMLALGINKQLDFQSLVTEVGRDLAVAGGLYSTRREIQLGFIAGVALVNVGALAGLLWASRRSMERRWPAIVGMVYILGFVTIRAASFHHVDALLRARLGGLRWNAILELGGIAMVGLAALRILLAPTERPGRPDIGMICRYGGGSR